MLRVSLCRDVLFSLCCDRFVCIVLYDTCFLNVYLPSGSNVCQNSVLDTIPQLEMKCVPIFTINSTLNILYLVGT